MRPRPLLFSVLFLLASHALAGSDGPLPKPPLAGFAEGASPVKNHPVRAAAGEKDAREGGEDAFVPFPVAVLPFFDAGFTCDNLDDYDEACPAGGSLSPDVVYAYTPSSDHYLTIDLCGSSYDTKVYVYEGAVTPGLPYACNDDFYPEEDPCGGWVSRIDGLPVQAGVSYIIVVDGWGGDCGTYQIRLDYGVPGPALDLSFEQLTFGFEGFDDAPYSAVGRAGFQFETPPSMGFLNMAAYVPGVSVQASWIVRNMIIPSSSMGPSTESIASRFPMEEMGIENGFPVSQIVYGYTITSSPLNDDEVGDWYDQLVLQGPVSVGQARIETHGYTAEATVFGGWLPDPLEWFKPFQLPENIHVNSWIGCDMPNVQLDSSGSQPGTGDRTLDWNGCGPAGCANSMKWLEDKHAEIDFPPNLRETFEQLSNLMNRLSKQGAGPQQILTAKLDFIEAYGLPIHVKYQTNLMEGNHKSTSGESEATDGDGAAAAFPDTAWINAEARAGEDIELGVGFYYVHNDTLKRDGGHIVVMTGTGKINGVPKIFYKHDTKQGDSTGVKQEVSDVDVRPGGAIHLPGLGGWIKPTPTAAAVPTFPFVEAAFSESYDATVGQIPAQHTMNAYCDWVKRTIAPGQKIEIEYPNNPTRCFNSTIWRLDRTVQPAKWVKVEVWNFNSGTTRTWVNPYPYPVTIAIHNDDHSTAGPYTVDLALSSVSGGDATSPSNESAYGGFSLGGTDGSSGEFGEITTPLVGVDGSLGVELSDLPARLTSGPGGTHLLVLSHPIPAWNSYWENLGLEIRVAELTSPGQLVVDCPSTGDHQVIDVIDTEIIALSLTSMAPATAFQITLQATSGLDFKFDCIGVPSLAPIGTGVFESEVPRVLALEANRPNPFNPETTIRFSLPKATDVSLEVYDIGGRLVETTAHGAFEAGRHEAVWLGVDSEGRPVASGTYFYRLRAGDKVLTGKMTLIR